MIHFNGTTFYTITAVRLGRCPKKDRPSKSSFVYMPQENTIDLDRQVRTEQMVLTVHAAYKKACEYFNDITKLLDKDEVFNSCYIFVL